MSDIPFYRTQMGHRFYEATAPSIARELARLNDNLERLLAVDERYDDGGFTGANIDRPAFTRLLADVEAGKIDVIVVYKVDRLSRSLLDFAKMMERFTAAGVSFVSVTQNFSTAGAMGRLTFNMLMSFAEFERSMIAERTRDKIAASRRKGKWTRWTKDAIARVLLHCGLCGEAMCPGSTTKKNGKTYRFYRCSKRDKHGKDACCARPLPAGISSQMRPSRSRPARFLFVPPHCLKKNGT